MIRIFAAMVAALLAGVAGAADLDPQYERIGTISAEIGGETQQLVVIRDTETGQAMAEQKKIMGSALSQNVVAVAVDDDGRPTRPNLQVTLMEQGGRMGLLSAEIFDDQGYDAPLVMGPDGGAGTLTRYAFEDGRLEAVVEGDFLRLQGYMSEPKPAEGATPVPAVLRLSVEMPPLE